MSERMPIRVSEAVNPGKIVSVSTTSTTVLSDTDADDAQVVIFVNNSDTDITVRPSADGAEAGKGVVLKASGGTWYEPTAATAFCACHHGSSGTKDLSVVLI